MSNPITWQNIQAPNNSDALAALNSTDINVANMFKSFDTALKDQQALQSANFDAQRTYQGNQFKDALANISDPTDMNAALTDGRYAAMKQGYTNIDPTLLRTGGVDRLTALQKQFEATNASIDNQRKADEVLPTAQGMLLAASGDLAGTQQWVKDNASNTRASEVLNKAYDTVNSREKNALENSKIAGEITNNKALADAATKNSDSTALTAQTGADTLKQSIIKEKDAQQQAMLQLLLGGHNGAGAPGATATASGVSHNATAYTNYIDKVYVGEDKKAAASAALGKIITDPRASILTPDEVLGAIAKVVDGRGLIAKAVNYKNGLEGSPVSQVLDEMLANPAMIARVKDLEAAKVSKANGMQYVTQLLKQSAQTNSPSMQDSGQVFKDAQGKVLGPILNTGTDANGTLAYRNRNPGNIKYGQWAKDHGAIGTDGTFAVFPDEATGTAAQKALLTGDGYKNLTISQMVDKWSPLADKGNTPEGNAAYKKAFVDAGLPTNVTISQLNPAQLDKLSMVQRTHEGYTPGSSPVLNVPAPVTPAAGAQSIVAGATPPPATTGTTPPPANTVPPAPAPNTEALALAAKDAATKRLAQQAQLETNEQSLGLRKSYSPEVQQYMDDQAKAKADALKQSVGAVAKRVSNAEVSSRAATGDLSTLGLTVPTAIATNVYNKAQPILKALGINAEPMDKQTARTWGTPFQQAQAEKDVANRDALIAQVKAQRAAFDAGSTDLFSKKKVDSIPPQAAVTNQPPAAFDIAKPPADAPSNAPAPKVNTSFASMNSSGSVSKTTEPVNIPDTKWNPPQTITKGTNVASTDPKFVVTIVPKFPAENAKVKKVIDGDTVLVKRQDGSDFTCRIDNINAPETSHGKFSSKPAQAFGDASKNFLDNMIGNKDVTMRVSREASGTGSNYGRGSCQFEIQGKNISEEMVRNGMAMMYRKYSADPTLDATEKLAQAAKVGIWSKGTPIDPADYSHMPWR